MKKYREVFTINPDEWQPYRIKPIYGVEANRVTENINILQEMLREVAKVGPLQGYDFESMRELAKTSFSSLLVFTQLPNNGNFARCYQFDKLVGFLAQDEKTIRLFISTEIELK